MNNGSDLSFLEAMYPVFVIELIFLFSSVYILFYTVDPPWYRDLFFKTKKRKNIGNGFETKNFIDRQKEEGK